MRLTDSDRSQVNCKDDELCISSSQLQAACADYILFSTMLLNVNGINLPQ